MKRCADGKKICKIASLFIFLLMTFSVLAYSVLASNDVAYIYKSKAGVDKNVVKVFEDMGFSVKLIYEKNIPTDLSGYRFIYVGDERFKSPNNIKVWKYPSIVSNYFYGPDFGLTDDDGVSKLTSSAPLNVKIGSNILQVYTRAKFPGGINIPYYFLAQENKANELKKAASPYTNNGNILGDVISYGHPGLELTNGKTAQNNICFFGIVESNYWTDNAVELFKQCIEHVSVICKSDNDCKDQLIGYPYCIGNKIYQNKNDFSCVNAGTINSECVSNKVNSLVKVCSNICKDGQCVCLDKDKDGYDECGSNEDGDDGKPADCDDDDANIHPGAYEICDGKDNDCNGRIDENNGDCNSGEVCSSGICTAIKCKTKTDCGVDGFIDGLFCSQNDVYQNYIKYTCENAGTVSSSCTKTVDSKKVVNCANSCSQGSCINILCNNNNDCNDNNPATEDICVNPGQITSMCTHENIMCVSNNDCGTDRYTGNMFCQGKDIYRNFISFSCNSANNINSFCSNSLEAKKLFSCTYACSSGSCVRCNNNNDCNDGNSNTNDFCRFGGTVDSFCSYEIYEVISCFKDSDCGSDSFTGNKFCSNGDVYQNFKDVSCSNPGSSGSFCSSNTNAKLVQDCNFGCENGVCKSKVNECSDGIDNDNDGKKDYPEDRGCLTVDDDNEAGEPYGYLDGVQNCQNIYGWTCDSDNYNQSIDVHLYKDGPVGAGGIFLTSVKANVTRESQVGFLCGGNSNHGFSFSLPNDLKDGKEHKIYAYAINIGTPSNNPELQQIPAGFSCLGPVLCIDNDKDGYDNCDLGTVGDDGKPKDCNDNNTNIYPNNPGNELFCHDGIDNDCDGMIDESNVAGSFNFNEEWELRDFINSLHRFTFLPDGEHDATSIKYDQLSANKICELKGYSSAEIKKVSSYASCFDNNHAYWAPVANDFKYFNACQYNLHIEKLLCTNPLICG